MFNDLQHENASDTTVGTVSGTLVLPTTKLPGDINVNARFHENNYIIEIDIKNIKEMNQINELKKQNKELNQQIDQLKNKLYNIGKLIGVDEEILTGILNEKYDENGFLFDNTR